MNLCQLSQKQYEEYDELLQYTLPGATHLANHYTYGKILYHKDYEYRLKFCRVYYETDLSCPLILKHNLQGKTLKIKRSSGAIEEILIEKDNPIIINNEDEAIIKVKVKKDNELLNKNVALTDKVSKRSGNHYMGFISQNPEVFNDDFIFEIGIENIGNDWFDKEREEWKIRISECLDKIDKFKYRFYDYND